MDLEKQPIEFDLDGFLPYRLNVAAARLSAEFAKHYKARFGLSVAEWRVLVHLLSAGDVSVREIEKRTNLEKSKVSRAAARLEAGGLIAKAINTEDKRLVKMALTLTGTALMRELIPVAERFQKQLEAELGDALKGLDAGLDRLLE